MLARFLRWFLHLDPPQHVPSSPFGDGNGMDVPGELSKLFVSWLLGIPLPLGSSSDATPPTDPDRPDDEDDDFQRPSRPPLAP